MTKQLIVKIRITSFSRKSISLYSAGNGIKHTERYIPRTLLFDTVQKLFKNDKSREVWQEHPKQSNVNVTVLFLKQAYRIYYRNMLVHRQINNHKNQISMHTFFQVKEDQQRASLSLFSRFYFLFISTIWIRILKCMDLLCVRSKWYGKCMQKKNCVNNP